MSVHLQRRVRLEYVHPPAARLESQLDDPHARAGILDARVESELRGTPRGSNTREIAADPDGISAYVRSVIVGNDPGVGSVALADWTSLYHVQQLFHGSLGDVDPFVALADLNAVLAAALFYDRVVVLDGESVIDDVGEALGIGDVLVSLSSNGGPLVDDEYSLLKWTLDDCFQSSAAQLSNLRRGDHLLGELHSAWGQMLPGVDLPDDYNVDRVGWSASPGRPTLLRQLFSRSAGMAWNLRLANDLVIDNDVRALTYENVAAVLTAAISSEELKGPNVRYVGGVLRAPMQRAIRAVWRRAWDEKGAIPAEVALNTWWRQRYSHPRNNPAFPFWLAAILEGSESRNDLQTQVRRWRDKALAFRSSRAALEADLLNGNVTGTAPYEQAFAGALDNLAEGSAIEGVATITTAGTHTALALTGMPPFLTQAAADVLDDEVKRLLKPTTSWLLRLTRPRLWFIAHSHETAQRLFEPQFKLNTIFALPFGDKAEPLDFLSRVNAVEWAV
jgi:hypothetical protein